MGWRVSDLWHQAITGPHTVRFHASSLRGHDVLADDLDVSDVTVTDEWDGKQKIREFRATVTDPTRRLLSMDAASPLAPWGQRLRVSAELSVGDAWSEVCPVGDFRIEQVTGDQAVAVLQSNGSWAFGGQQVQVTCRDMLQQMADEKWTTTVRPSEGPTVDGEMGRILANTGLSYAGLFRGNISAKLDYGDSRLDALLSIADACPGVLWSDRNGRVAIIRTTGMDEKWTFDPGADAWVTWTPTADRQGVANGVVVEGSSSDDRYPVRGAAWITDGPLAWGGPFGMIPTVVQDNTVYSSAGATRKAQDRLAKDTAAQVAQLTVTVPANPAIDAMDHAIIVTEDRTLYGLITKAEHTEESTVLTVQIPWDQVWIS
jgi:hypothetical protein